VHERGGEAGPAARALWQEFVSARRGLLALVRLRVTISTASIRA
jgi:hypothetical protein